jgi:hypothetical protein
MNKTMGFHVHMDNKILAEILVYNPWINCKIMSMDQLFQKMCKRTKIIKKMLHIMRNMDLKEDNQTIYKLYQHKQMNLLVNCVIRMHILLKLSIHFIWSLIANDWWIVELCWKYWKELFNTKPTYSITNTKLSNIYDCDFYCFVNY